MNVLMTFLAVIWIICLNAGLALSSSYLNDFLILQVQTPASQAESDRKSAELKQREPKGESNGGGDQTSADHHIVQSPNLALKLAFLSDPRLFPYDIECHIKEKTVELTGVVAFEEEKILAALLTAQLVEEKDILNHLEVRPALHGTIQAASDARVTELVKQRFAQSQTLKEANFEVITIRGIVSLRGRTRFQVIALEAAQTAREIPGVFAVDTQHVRIE
jgi:osmotically-inducible protein OsmY